ncbi:hypothetical protein ABT294_02580 [Nonomuraea sp. NPDC000554]|uniref:hypothetical protein n=1 Tax=Nonomuraea sp. NPDC000554 TaxID=3154259 RepID=UPI00332971F4
MMATFDEAAVDRLIAAAQQPLDGLHEAYLEVLAVHGVAQDPDKLVSVECSAQGVTGLDIDPRALRWGSRRLADTILELIAQSLADLQAKSDAIMADRLGEGPLDLTSDDNAAVRLMQDTQLAYDQAMDGAMAELARIRSTLDGP